jgi:DNA-binding CsgD family transcriptional regulator
VYKSAAAQQQEEKGRLTVREKQVMEIKESLGLDGKYPSNAEVAQALGMTSSNVSSMLTNARKKLTGLPPDLLDGRKNKTVNATTLDVLDAIQKKSVNELQRRVANKQNLKNMPIEELLALIKGAGSAMAQEVNLNNAGAGDDKIVFEGDQDIFKVAGVAETPAEESVDADSQDREDQSAQA